MKTKFEFIKKDYLNVIDYFNNNKDNRTTVIAKNCSLSVSKANYYLNLYLSLKKNYMGEEVIYPDNFYD